jgi:hypothetical protein
MTVDEIVIYCAESIGDTSSETKDFAARALRLKYATLYDAHAWRESMRTLEAVPVDPALNGSIFLPYDCEEVIFLSLSRDAVNYSRLLYRDRDWIERVAGPTFLSPGNLPWYYRGENLAWPAFNPGRLTFTTSTTSPFTVSIEGRTLAGDPVQESFILNGIPNPDGTTTPVSVTTVNSYAYVTSLSKTGGILKIQGAGSPITMSAADNSAVFSQFVLYPPPVFTNPDGSNNTLYARIRVKLKCDPLDSGMSVPRISHIFDALIEFTLSSLYTRDRQLTKADTREQKAIAHIQAAVNLEKNQAESFQQVIPTIYDTGSYLDRGVYVSSLNPPFF